jgi:protein-S-isoprenylcysteine O-methyltransferase Ste14
MQIGAMQRAAAALRAIGHVVFRWRDYLAPLAVVLVMASARSSDFVVDVGARRVLVGIGLVVLLAGQLIRIAVAGYGVVRRAGVDRRISASRLVTEGLYAHTRNPLYGANLLLLGGLAALYGSRPVLLIGMPVLALVLVAMVTAEEEFLARRFGGDYAAYRRRADRFIPRIRGLKTTLAPLPFDVRRAVRREYGTVFSVASTALALLARRRVALDGLAGARPALLQIAAAWGMCALAYALVRWVKKTKRLETLPPALDDMAWRRDDVG